MEMTKEQQIQQLNEEYKKQLEQIQRGATDNPSAEQAPGEHQETHESEPVPLEHQAISHTSEKMIQEQIPNFQASSHTPGSKMDDLPEDAQTKVNEWVKMAGADPYGSVKTVKDYFVKTGDMALVDAYHGAVTSDSKFQELVKTGQLKEL